MRPVLSQAVSFRSASRQSLAGRASGGVRPGILRRCGRIAVSFANCLVTGGLIAGCLVITSGCSSLTFKIDGKPASTVSPAQRAQPKRDLVPIDISLLTQPRPDAYRVDEGDVLGLVVEGLVPFRGPDQTPQLPPVQFPENDFRVAPAIGVPVAVQADGVLSAPMIKPINVRGLTLPEVSQAIREAYNKADILKEEAPMPIVTLINPRQTTVLVVREDTGQGVATQLGVNDRQGVGGPVTLPAYKNDVLNALMSSGGLPGLRAKNEIRVFRRGTEASRQMAVLNPDDFPPGLNLTLEDDETLQGSRTIIPLRVRRGTIVNIRPEDVILGEGDIVYIGNRDTEVFYTAGLLPAGEHLLPRDYDIDIFEAMSIAGYSYGTSGVSGGGGGGLIPQGSNVPPTQLFIMREREDGCEYTIEIDLERAIKCADDRLLIKPGDKLLLRHSPCEESVNFGIFTFFTFGIRELFN